MPGGGFWPQGVGFDCTDLKDSFFSCFPFKYNDRNKLRLQNKGFDDAFCAVAIF
jgi:hypothetical protein